VLVKIGGGSVDMLVKAVELGWRERTGETGFDGGSDDIGFSCNLDRLSRR
jgi:hypothetical protein